MGDSLNKSFFFFFAMSMSTTSKPQLTDEQIQILKAKFTQFLVIGRANAGKTTILRRLCNLRRSEDASTSDIIWV